MPDPAILALLQHLNWTPPAIVQSISPSVPKPWVVAFEQQMTENERNVDEWIAMGKSLRSDLQSIVAAQPEVWTTEMLSAMITVFDHALVNQSRVVARLTKKMDRQGRRREDPVKTLFDRLLSVSIRYLDEGRDFSLFLRAMRAEVNPESRGGPSFDSPEELEKHLYAQAS